MSVTDLKLECRGCGSSLNYSAKDLSLKCPYCNTITEIPKSEDELPDHPESIIPLTVELTELVDSVYEHLASGDMTPDHLLEHATFTKTERFYVPAYIFHGDFEAQWTASFGYDRKEQYIDYETRTVNGNTRRVPVTKTKTVTDWRPVNGTDAGKYVVFAYAGKQYFNATVSVVSLIESRSDADLVPFDTAYMAGLEVEPFVSLVDDCYTDRASPQIHEIIKHSVYRHAQGDRQKDWHWTSNIKRDSVTALIPICHAVYEFEGKSYNVWTSGANSSKLIADKLPVDMKRQMSVYEGFVPLGVVAFAAAYAVFKLNDYWMMPIIGLAIASLYGYLRQKSIIQYSRDLRQSMLHHRRAASANTAAMSEAEQQAIIKSTTRPKRSWLFNTDTDKIKIPLIAVVLAIIPLLGGNSGSQTKSDDSSQSVVADSSVPAQQSAQQDATVNNAAVQQSSNQVASAVTASQSTDLGQNSGFNIPTNFQTPLVGNCEMGSCSWSKGLAVRIVKKSSEQAILEVKLLGGESAFDPETTTNKPDDIHWNKKPHVVVITCSYAHPSVSMNGQVDDLPLGPNGVPGVLLSSASLYFEYCHSFHGDEDAIKKFGYNIQDVSN
jgi:hypothetical protein